VSQPATQPDRPAPPDAGGFSIRRNAVHAIVGTGTFHLCHLAMLVILNKCAAPEVTGQYFLAMAIATPLILFFGLELRGALVADAAGQFSVGTYFALRRIMMLVAATLLVPIVVWQFLAEPNTALVVLLAGVFAGRLCWTLAEVGWATYQRRERLDVFARSFLWRGAVVLLPFAALLLPARYLFDTTVETRTHLAAAATLLYAVGFAAVWWLYDRPRMRNSALWDLNWRWRDLARLAAQTLPLGIVALVVNLCDSFPRWMFDPELTTTLGLAPPADGKAQLGYFGSLAYITMAGNLVVIQATAAAANRLATRFLSDLRSFLALLAKLLLFAALLGAAVLAIAWLFGRPILATLYTPAVAAYEQAFRIIVAAHALALLTNVLGAATTQMRVFWLQVPAQALTLAATLVAAIVLIPGPDPVTGAAQTALVRAMTQFVLYVICVSVGVGLRPRLIGPKTVPPNGA
jgi:O-antigen/teichoic acid export membrane protein